MVLGKEESQDNNKQEEQEQFYYVVVGYYRNLDNAKNFAQQLNNQGIITTIQKGRLEQQ